MPLLGLAVLIIVLVGLFVTPVRATLYGWLTAAYYWVRRQGRLVKRIIYGFIWAAVCLIVLVGVAIAKQNTGVLGFLLILTFIPWFIAVSISGSFKVLRGIEKALTLIFMFFSPFVVLLMGDIKFALSPAGQTIMMIYTAVCLFLMAIGGYRGISRPKAVARFLSFCFFLVLIFVLQKKYMPGMYEAQKLSVSRWTGKTTSWVTRKSFNNGLKASVTYSAINHTTVAYDLSGGTWSEIDTTEVPVLMPGQRVAVAKHGAKTTMWDDEQMTQVRLPAANGLLTGKVIWVPSRFLTELQGPKTETATKKTVDTVQTAEFTPPGQKPIYQKTVNLDGEWRELEVKPGLYYRYQFDTEEPLKARFKYHPETEREVDRMDTYYAIRIGMRNPGNLPLEIRTISGRAIQVPLTVVKMYN